MCVLALAFGLSVTRDDGGDGRRGEDLEAATPTTEPSLPRGSDAAALANYCTVPGEAWAEVPRHEPGAPSRLWVQLDQGEAIANGSEVRESVMWSDSGSTVISPETDGRFTDDASVLERTRAVACVSYLGTDEVGTNCPYGDYLSGRYSLRTGRLRFEIVVYELHSGGILHRGEIHSRSQGCPEWWQEGEGGNLVTRAITERDVMDWLSTHFVGGRPA